ncbi:MAG: ABC transporter ATP-binding protein [Candidatus Tectomicrobia bacterium]|uniref:ABC transporter ATP-binding protein n=1 Tax=Tectimicrobiota bacterium TaxID=2528274 RepID=A0A932GQI1_UNCTE|nr:ABC transporter ATP-binding protein [Candidatus Tectomicrobia bacterium]
MSSPNLLVKKLCKNFGGLQAVNDLSLALEPGERRAIIGPNGAGKTTLFNLISGAFSPSSGEIYLFGKEVTRVSPHRRAALGLARTFQITNLFPNLSLFENVLLAVQALDTAKYSALRPVSFYRHLEKRTYELLEEWGMREKAGELARNLSHGDQRQVEIILALAGNPRLLLLDEPTSGLSPAETSTVTEAIRKLDSNITIALIEHDMDVAFALADRVSVLHFGSLLAEGSVSEIKDDPRVTEIYLGGE